MKILNECIGGNFFCHQSTKQVDDDQNCITELSLGHVCPSSGNFWKSQLEIVFDKKKRTPFFANSQYVVHAIGSRQPYSIFVLCNGGSNARTFRNIYCCFCAGDTIRRKGARLVARALKDDAVACTLQLNGLSSPSRDFLSFFFVSVHWVALMGFSVATLTLRIS